MPGYYDEMGVYVYAEDDTFVNASSWLNKLGKSLSDAVKRQYDVNTAPTDNAVAALFNTPGSATRAAAGVTATASAMASLDARLDVLEPLNAGDVAMTTFTPSFGNLTIGTGTGAGVIYARYSVTKGRCVGLVVVQVGTGFTVGDAFLRYPVPIATALADTLIDVGDLTHIDVSAGVRYTGSVQAGPSATNGLRFALINTTGTFGAFSNGAVSSTSPFTWAAGDRIAVEFDYPVA